MPIILHRPSYSRKKELENHEIKICNPSHHGASMLSMLINPPNGYQNLIKVGSFQEKKDPEKSKKNPKNSQRNLCAKKLSYLEETVLQETPKSDRSPLGATSQGLLSFYSTWPRRGFSSRLLGFLLDIRPPLSLYPLKI